MAQRHRNDTVERLGPGTADPRHPRYVEVELRDTVADCPPDIENKLRRELYSVKEMVRVLDLARGHTVVINPSANSDDLETGVIWAKRRWAATRLLGETAEATQHANDARLYRCEVCRQVVSPGLTHRHTRRRPLADGTSIHACADCVAVADHLAVTRLAAEQVDGRSRAELAAEALDRNTT